MESHPSYELWKRLSPLVLKIKAAFLNHITGANGDVIQSYPRTRRQATDIEGLDTQERAKRNCARTVVQYAGLPSERPLCQPMQDRASLQQSSTLELYPQPVPRMADNVQGPAKYPQQTTGEKSQQQLLWEENNLMDSCIYITQQQSPQSSWEDDLRVNNNTQILQQPLRTTGEETQQQRLWEENNFMDNSIYITRQQSSQGPVESTRETQSLWNNGFRMSNTSISSQQPLSTGQQSLPLSVSSSIYSYET